jgi:hypothetical protein
LGGGLTIKKYAAIAQKVGFFISFLALLLVLFNNSIDKSVIGALMMLGLIIGIIGGMLSDMTKIMVVALCFSLLSVAIYFYISNGVIFKICLFASILLLLFDMIANYKRKILE